MQKIKLPNGSAAHFIKVHTDAGPKWIANAATHLAVRDPLQAFPFDSFSAMHCNEALTDQGYKGLSVVTALPHAKDSHAQQCELELFEAGYSIGPRDPRVSPGYPGAFMVTDPLDHDDGYVIVGDSVDELVLTAHAHLVADSEQFKEGVSSPIVA